jgi:hypothetical protein
MQALRAEKVSAETYLAWEREQQTRNEYYDGLINAVGGGSRRHVVITGNAYAGFKSALQG